MGQFRYTTGGIEDATIESLDSCALNSAGVWGAIQSAYTCRDRLPERVHDYRPMWVATGGVGNAGTIVLRPASRRAAELLRQGRIAALMRRFPTLSFLEAQKIEDARKGVQYGLESRVEDCVVSAILGGWVGILAGMPPVGCGVNRWAEKNPGLTDDLSAPRASAAGEIARNYLARAR